MLPAVILVVLMADNLPQTDPFARSPALTLDPAGSIRHFRPPGRLAAAASCDLFILATPPTCHSSFVRRRGLQVALPN